MNKLRKNRAGFTTIEILLVILILVIAGFAGYYVYHSQKTPKSNNDTTSSATKATSKTSEKPTETSQQEYLKLADWGIKIPINDEVAGLRRVGGGFTDNKLSAFCDSSSTNPNGSHSNDVLVQRGKATDLVTPEAGESNTTFAEQFSNPSVNADWKYAHIGDYYYVHPNFAGASCVTTDNKALQQQEESATKAIVAALKQAIVL